MIQRLLEVTETASVGRGPPLDQILLPEFDPDSSNVTAKGWCSTIDVFMKETLLSGGKLLLALSRALKGAASQWLVQVSHDNLTWDAFKEAFLAQYDVNETPASVVFKVLDSRPKEDENYVSYANQIVSTLSSKLQGMSTEEIILNFSLAHMAKLHPRIRHLVYTTEIRNREKMIKELKSIR